MNKLLGGAIGVFLFWLVGIKMGLLDLVIGGILTDFAAELNRMTGPLTALLIALAVPVALVGLMLTISKGHRALGIELMVVAMALVFGARMMPVAGQWANTEAAAMSANLSHSSTITLAPAQPAPGR
jgi:hypothetical protein